MPGSQRTRRKEKLHNKSSQKTISSSGQKSFLSFFFLLLFFLLIIRHLIDGRQLIARLEVNKQINLVFDTTDLNALEDVMGNLDDLALTNPTKAVELITGLADKLNEMSENSVS